MGKGLCRGKNAGFSLVELIVVIAIMAILVGVAVPVYTSYVEKAEKTADEQYLAEVVYAAQLFAAEKGLELDKIAIAPVVKADAKQGIELFLKDGTRVEDLDELYAMMGDYTFATKNNSTEVHYHRPSDPPLAGSPTDPENHTHHYTEVIQSKTCTQDGIKGCECGATEIDSAMGHTIDANGDDYILIGNLRIYTCTADGCDYQVVIPQGNLIG